jgi:hypothetical protein
VEDKTKDVFAIYEDTVHKSSPPAVILAGPELASMMKIGTRVVRGVDWKWGDQVSTLLLGTFAKLQKAIISFVMSDHLCVYLHGTTRLPPDGFSCSLIFGYFSKIC